MSNLSDNIEPQLCKAIVGASDAQGMEFSEEKPFEIVTNPSFEFDVLLCKDKDCNDKAKIFIKDYVIFIDYYSEVPEPLISATLTYPNVSTRKFTLPTSLKAEQIGTYESDIVASKEGYKTITKRIQFGVIEKEAKIEYRSLIRESTKEEEKEESIQTAEKPMQTPKQERLFFIIPILIVIITVSFIAYLELFRKRDEKMANKRPKKMK